MMRSQPSILEITVVSAQGIKKASSNAFFSAPPRPFVTITPAVTCPSPSDTRHVYRTRVDDVGGVNPTWGDKFQIPLDPAFFTAGGPMSGLYLNIFTKRALLGRGPAQLGWCHIPFSDVLDGPPGSSVGRIRNLSYRVRAKDGSRGEGVLNVVVRLMGSDPDPDPGRPVRGLAFGGTSYSHTAIGIPITLCPPTITYDRPPYV